MTQPNTLPNFLDNISIIMVETTLPANIGSAARAMMTTGLSSLVLVNPKKAIDDTSYAHAKGGTPILDKARTVSTLDEALADCQLIFAASSRVRHLPRPVVSPDVAAIIIDDFVKNHQKISAQVPKIALLFGREAHGLSNEELAVAHYHLQIPANPTYPVLNIASSIQVIGSFFYAYYAKKLTKDNDKDSHKHLLNISIRQDWDEPAITHTQSQKLHQNLINLLIKINIAHEDNLAHLPNRLSRLGTRLQLDQKEYALLMALVHKIDGRL